MTDTLPEPDGENAPDQTPPPHPDDIVEEPREEPMPDHDADAHLLVGDSVDPDYEIDTASFVEDEDEDDVDLDPGLPMPGATAARSSNWYPAPAITSLQRDLDDAYPKRTKPDWILGDAAHSARDSDHNPDAGGMVHAIDIRLGGDLDVDAVLHSLIGDSRVWYVIYNRVIYSRTYDWAPRRYTGANPHDTHIHVSFRYLHAAEQNTSPWGFDHKVKPGVVDLSVVRHQFLIALGKRDGKVRRRASVRRVQRALNARMGAGLATDGIVGPKTLSAWKRWESKKKVPGRGREIVPDHQSLKALVEPKWKVVS